MTNELIATQIHDVDETFQVVSVIGGVGRYQKRPCIKCPWREDAAGEFPSKAFLHSAITAHDMSTHRFACHQAGIKNLTTCAGFILRGSDHNLSMRMQRIRGRDFDDVTDGGHELHANYRAMAIANGVDPDDPALALCRD